MMERLTIRTLKGAALKMDDTYLNEEAARSDLMQRYRIAVDRLAAYEDTGLEPAEILKVTATDTSPVAHGWWRAGKVRGSFALLCSECGCDTGVNYDFAYCPNCSAKMDLPKENP